MRVVNSSNLWDNHAPKKHYFSGELLLLPLFLVTIVAATTLLLPSTSSGPVNRKTVKATSSPSTLAATYTAPTKQLLPEESDLGDMLLNKLTTPELPPADCATISCLALTFDDGPNAASTPKILDALEHEGATATFFLVGNRISNNSASVLRMYQNGYEVGNHSWAHPDFTRLNAVQIQQQIDLTQNAITSLGLAVPKIFRLPYGLRNNFVRQHINLPIIMWNVDPKDWREQDPNRIVEIVESQAKPGAIILMHDRIPTADAAPRIIHDLKTKYRLVTVSELLNLQPDSKGEFFGR